MYILLACIPVSPGSQTGSQAIPAFFAAVNLHHYKEEGGMKRVEGRKHFQGEGVRRENARKRRVFQPAPGVFGRGAKSAICGERGMGRFSAVLLWAERSHARRGILNAPVWAEQSPAPTRSIWLFRGDGDSPFICGGAIPRPSGYIGCSCMGGALPRPYEVNLVILRGRGFPVYIRRSDPAPVGVRLALL